MKKLLATFSLLTGLLLAANAFAVDLEWDPNADGQGVLGYYLYWQRSDGAGQVMQATIDGRLTTHVTIQNSGNFIEGIDYELWLTAFNSAEESGSSNTVTFSVPWPGGTPITPDQPNGLRFSDQAGTLITNIKPVSP